MVMKKILGICFLFIRILVVPVCSVPTNQDKLVSVAVIMRHGERTFKQNTYPNDPYRNLSFGHRGFAQLTNKGMQQAFDLGQWMRGQYDEFLSRWYTEEEIYVISSDEDRCIMTAQCALAGLYPPELDDKWNAQILWQPIPVHTIPKGDDIITYNSRKCPNFSKRVKEIVISDEYFNKIDNENIQLFANLSEHLGVEIKTFWDVQEYYDILRIEELLNLTLPSWTHGIYPDKILPLVELRLQAHTYTPELKRLSIGPLLNKILTYFQNTISEIHKEPKFLMFSSHRSKLTNVLFSLNFENIGRNIPNCGDMLIFELKQKISKRNSYYVNILYKQDVSSEPKHLILKNCDEDCNYDTLVQILKPISIDLEQWEKECYSE